MVRLHATRLMRGGEIVFWRDGEMVWQGTLGVDPGINFDAISMHVDDAAQISHRVGTVDLTPERLLGVLANWWG